MKRHGNPYCARRGTEHELRNTAHFAEGVVLHPREAYPARLVAKERIPRPVIVELERRGHEVIITDDWANGKVMGIRYDEERGLIFSAVLPRGEVGYAPGW